MARFPAVKARRLLALFQREPLAYEIVRRHGSHRVLASRRGYPTIVFAFHDRATVPGHTVRKVLVKDVGLGEHEARRLL